VNLIEMLNAAGSLGSAATPIVLAIAWWKLDKRISRLEWAVFDKPQKTR